MMNVRDNWWISEEEGGFFGPHYMLGDNSKLGPYLQRPMTLEERTEREVKFLMEALQLEASTRVLDCPCGYGRHSLALAKRGMRVTGADVNNSYLNLARLKAKELGLKEDVIDFIKADMRQLPDSLGDFDVAINMFTSFGFFRDEEDDLEVLKGFHRRLKEHGKVLIYLDYNYERRFRGFKDERVTRHLKDGSRLIVTERPLKGTKRIVGKWEIIKSNNKQIYSSTYNLRLYSADELAEMLEGCGFSHVQKKGDLDNSRRAFSQDSYDTIVIAEKS